MHLLLLAFYVSSYAVRVTDKQQMSYASSSPCNQKGGVKSGREEWKRNKWERKKFGSISNLYVQWSAEWRIKGNHLNYKLRVVNYKIKVF